MIRFRCRECGKKLKAEEDIIGRKVSCTRCENIEVVPPEDNLAKPQQDAGIQPAPAKLNVNEPAETRPNSALQRSNQPPRSRHRSTQEIQQLAADSTSLAHSGQDLELHNPLANDTIADDIESLLAGGVKSNGKWSFEPGGPEGVTEEAEGTEAFEFEPKFKVAQAKRSPLFRGSLERRHLLIGMATLAGLALTVALAVGLAALLRSPTVFSSDFEELNEVGFYRSAKINLNKSYRALEITAKAEVAQGRREPADDELAGFLQSVETLTEPNTIDDAYQLFNADQITEARMLLSKFSKQMKQLGAEIDARIKSLSRAAQANAN